ncbi:MAG: efflux RND transporter periplasmic adaptor subunit [Archangium sp.]
MFMWSDSKLASVLGVGLALTACSKPAETSKTPIADAQGVTLSSDAPQWKYLSIAVASEGAPLSPLPVPGHVDLDPRRTSAVGAPLPGRVEAVLVRAGSRVKKGDKLFSVKSGAYVEIERDTSVSRAQVAVRERLVARAKELLELKAAPQKEVLAAEAELEEARLALRAAESKQRSLAVTPEGDGLFWVRAPRNGTVVDLDVFPGLEVGPERDKPLIRLSDLDEVLVIADVPESDVNDVNVGEKATVTSTSGDTLREGIVEYVSEVVEPRRRTVEVWVRALNADRVLRPNGFVEIAFHPDEDGKVLRVPDAAVVTRGSSTVVFVATAPGRLEPKTVKTGRRRDGETEIRNGLATGDRYVSRGALLLLNQVDLVAEH